MFRLKPEIFPKDFTSDGIYGTLGYPGILKTMLFKKEKEFLDSHRGLIYELTCQFTDATFNSNLNGGAQYKREGAIAEGTIMIIAADLEEVNS